MVSRNSIMPRRRAVSAPAPARTTNGSPVALRRMSISSQASCAPMPVPKAFAMASFAANRAA
jgi:hypothetical protein